MSPPHLSPFAQFTESRQNIMSMYSSITGPASDEAAMQLSPPLPSTQSLAGAQDEPTADAAGGNVAGGADAASDAACDAGAGATGEARRSDGTE